MMKRNDVLTGLLAVTCSVSLSLLSAAPSSAEPPGSATLSGQVAQLAFLLGNWTQGAARVRLTASSSGRFTFEPAAGGRALLRRDHNDFVQPDGRTRRSYDQVMIIYPESGHLRADWFDGEHSIHYTNVKVDPGHSVLFEAPSTGDGPSYRLTYLAQRPGSLDVNFEIAGPGSRAFTSQASGKAVRR